MKYIAFLRFVLSFGTDISKFLDALEKLLGVIQPRLPTPQVGAGLEMTEVSAEEEAVEAEIGQLLGGPTAAWDGTRIRRIFKLLNDIGLLGGGFSDLLGKLVPKTN